MPGKQFLMVAMPFDGALVAFLVVLAGALAAPCKRLFTAFIVLILGATLAWVMVGEMYPPTYYPPKLFPDGPPRVWSPIIGTYVGGLIGVLVIAIRERKKVQPSVAPYVAQGAPPGEP